MNYFIPKSLTLNPVLVNFLVGIKLQVDVTYKMICRSYIRYFKGADALVISSPIYYFTMSAQTKLFIDRWYALGEQKDSAISGKQIGIVLTYADADPFTSGAINAIRTFQDIFDYLGASIVSIVYGQASEAGEIKTNQDLMDKAYKMGQLLAIGK